MPYRNAPYYVLVCIAVIAGGFWPSYFAAEDTVPWQFHSHGIAASIWVVMVFVQSWTVHKEQLPLHRAVGKSSLLLFPFLIAGLASIIDLTAKGFAAADSPARVMFGAQFLIGMAVAIAAYVVLYYRALKYRRKVWVHSGYMLATPLILFESPFSRLMNMVLPPFMISGPQDFDRIMSAILWAMALSLAFIAAIWFNYRDKANPFLVAGAFIVIQMLTMGLLGGNALLEALLTMLAEVPGAVIWIAGFVLGALTSWAGWNAGKRPVALVEARQLA